LAAGLTYLKRGGILRQNLANVPRWKPSCGASFPPDTRSTATRSLSSRVAGGATIFWSIYLKPMHIVSSMYLASRRGSAVAINRAAHRAGGLAR